MKSEAYNIIINYLKQAKLSKMKVTTCILAAFALLNGTSLARKSYLIKLAHKDQIPMVKAGTPEYVIFENTDDDFIINYNGALAAAWDWGQTMEEDQNAFPDTYHLTLDIVFKQSLEFSPILSMPRLIYWEPALSVEEFTIGYKFDLAYFWEYPDRDDKLCLSSYFKIGERSIISTLVMRFQECYKTLV